MTVITDLFTALFYEMPGMVLGNLLVAGIIIALLILWKYAAIFTVILSVYFAFSYTSYFSNSEPVFNWMFIMWLFFALIQGIYALVGKDKK